MTSTKKITKIMHNWEEYEVWWGWYSTVVVTLTSSWRSSNSQTVNVTGVTADSTVIVSPEPNSISDYADCSVYCSAQWSGTLTFSCSSTPSNDIVVNCIVMNDGNVIIMPPLNYEAILAMATAEWNPRTNTVTELNKYPTEYHTMLSEWNHITNRATRYMWSYDTIDWIVLKYQPDPEVTFKYYYRIAYNVSNDNRWSTMWYFGD